MGSESLSGSKSSLVKGINASLGGFGAGRIGLGENRVESSDLGAEGAEDVGDGARSSVALENVDLADETIEDVGVGSDELD